MIMQHRTKRYTVSSLEQASAIYCQLRDKSGQGASRFPGAVISKDGQAFARISYNGRVWPLAEWTEGQTPLYCNR